VAACIPNSLDVPASTNRGVAIVLDEPEHPVSVALRTLADGHVRPERATAASIPMATAAIEPPPPVTRRDLRLLRREGRR
jgi:hypothetical protein